MMIRQIGGNMDQPKTTTPMSDEVKRARTDASVRDALHTIDVKIDLILADLDILQDRAEVEGLWPRFMRRRNRANGQARR